MATVIAGALLRSGSLREFTPLGAVGRPVYSAASQLRAAVRRLPDDHADALANLLAIPRQSEKGDIIDWYAPAAGDVVPWSAATTEERVAAKATLQEMQARLAARSSELQKDEENSERQVFGKLLAQATQIPSDEHIYLVDSRPVITFWGFHPREAQPGLDVIANLDTGAGAPEAARPVAAEAAAAVATEPVVAAEAPVVVRRQRWWWWLPLLLLALLLLSLMGMKSCGVEVPIASKLPDLPFFAQGPKQTPATDESRVTTDQGRVVDERTRDTTTVIDREDRTVIDRVDEGVAVGGDQDGTRQPKVVPADEAKPLGEGQQQRVMPLDETGKPEQQPDQTGALKPEQKPDKDDEQKPLAQTPPEQQGAQKGDRKRDATKPPLPNVPQPPPVPGVVPHDAPKGTPLSIPEGALKAGNTDFLNGAWRSITGLQDRAGNPIELNYDFQNGQGKVSLQRGVGSQQQTCAGQAGSIVEGGKLIINQKAIRCPDGTTFQDSKVQCSVGADGRAHCQGSNDDGSAYDVSIVK